MGVTAYIAVLNVIEYSQYNVSTKIQRSYSSDIMFPAITFCNFNRYVQQPHASNDSYNGREKKYFLLLAFTKELR